jgi:hypothetical protein
MNKMNSYKSSSSDPTIHNISSDPEFRVRVLEAIHTNPMIRYAELAKRLNVSTGLITTFMRKCARAELLEIRRLSPKRFIYLLTPKGVTEMMGRHYNRFSRNLDFFFGLNERFQRVLSEIHQKGFSELLLWIDDRGEEGKIHNWIEVLEQHLRAFSMRLCGVVARGVSSHSLPDLKYPVYTSNKEIERLAEKRMAVLVIRSWYEDAELLDKFSPNLFALTGESIQKLKDPGESLLANLGLK